MTQEKGLLVIPAKGTAMAFGLLVVAESYAKSLCNQGKGPVQIVSRYTGDVLATIEGEQR